MPWTWPTLSRGSQRDNYQQFPLEDTTVRSMSLDGRVKARKAARPLLYGYSFSLRYLTPLDKELLEQFQLDVKVGGEPFEWTDERPVVGSATAQLVRLASPMVFDLDNDGFQYRTEVELEQEWVAADSGG